MTAKNNPYVDHEVRIRLLEELLTRVDHKLNWMISLVIGSIIIPVLLRSTGFI